MEMARLCALTGLSVLTLAGCSFRTQTTGMAVEYNEFVAQTTNRQTVLNILRGKMREPMHFTSFSVVRGTVRGQGSASLSGTLARNGGERSTTVTTAADPLDSEVVTANSVTRGAQSLSPALGLQVSTGTDFDIAVNPTDEFYRGILGPLKEELVVHFLRQGFPKELLTYLLVGEFRFYASFKKDGKPINEHSEIWKEGDKKYDPVLIRTLRNTPYDAVVTADFAKAVNCRNLDYVTERRDKRVIGFNSLADLSSVSADMLEKVSSPQDTSNYRYTFGESTDFSLALSGRNDCGVILSELLGNGVNAVNTLVRTRARSSSNDFAAVPVLSDAVPGLVPAIPADGSPLASVPEIREANSRQQSVSPEGSGIYRFETKNFFKPLLDDARLSKDKHTGDLVIEITLRSVEGILYYLGEYIRDSESSPKLHDEKLCPASSSCVPILVVKPKDEAVGDSFVDVVYRGTKYSVPLSGAKITKEAGRSSQTISFVQQLLNLHRTAKDLPVTPVVRVSN